MIISPYFLLHIYLGEREKEFKRESLEIVNNMYLITVFCRDNELSTEILKYMYLI